MVNFNHYKKNWKNYFILFLIILFLGNILVNSNFIKSQITPFNSMDSQELKYNSKTSIVNKNLAFSLQNEDRKIIKNANLNLETNNYEMIYEKIKKTIKKYDGLILNENTYLNSNKNKNLNLNIKIESLELENILNEIKSYGEITNLNIYSNDVTKIYEDYSNRSLRYQNQISKYYLMLEKKNITIKEEIEIQKRVDQLENQIFNIENNKNNLNKNIKYSTLNINLKEKPSIYNEVNFLGFNDILKEILKSINNLIILIINIIGYMVLFSIFYGIYILGRKLINKFN